MLDSLQFNYLGCYGNKWIKTPNPRPPGREGILFENNYIEGLPTVPCRRSMHTGRYHLHDKGWSALDMEDTTIADLLLGAADRHSPDLRLPDVPSAQVRLHPRLRQGVLRSRA